MFVKITAPFLNAIHRYKVALQAQPTALVAWRELATCYELSGQHHSSAAALKSGMRILCPVGEDDGAGGDGTQRRSGAAKVAPLYLQMGANSLSMPGQEEAGLACIGDAFRFGKGGVAGHVLRGLVYSRLGRDGPAVSALGKAKEAGLEPAVAVLVDQLVGEGAPMDAD